MKPSLQLKISQQLTMTPQLQQAIRLLQLSTLDLQQEIQQALDSNPMLEMEEDGEQDSSQDQHNDSNDNNSDADERPDNTSAEASQDHKNADDDSGFDSDSFAKDNFDNNSFEAESSFDPDDPVADSNWNEQIPVELSTDSTWDDTYQNAPSSTPSSASGGDDDQGDYESTDHAAETLHDHLLWQLNLTPMSELDRLIAMNIIDGIDEDGYLRTDLQDILESFLDDHADELPTALNGVDVSTASAPPVAADADLDNGQEGVVELDEIEAVLHRIQQFDPPGVACRDLRECLLTQLNQLPETTPALNDARLVIDKHLPLLGSHDYKQLMRRCRLKEPQLKAAVELIQQLNPRPGNQIEYNEVEYVIPDVIVKKEEGVWRIQLNPDSAPRIRINDHYASMVKRADTSADNTYLRNHLQEARWFLKSLHSRNDTLLRVSSKIVEHQQDFLEYGEEAMKPLILHDIAEAVEMHESTISRVTTQKYMHTPRGIFELKYFFSSHVGTATGGECSSTAIRAIIKKLVAAENVAKPLSDSKIASLLDEQGINVARRTIAKYREAMNIPPSNERKRLV